MIPCSYQTGLRQCANEAHTSIRVSIPGRPIVQLHLCTGHHLVDDNQLMILALAKLDRQPGTTPRDITPADIAVNRLIQNRHTGTLSRVVTIARDTIRIRSQSDQTLGFPIEDLFVHYQLPGAIEEPTPTIS